MKTKISAALFFGIVMTSVGASADVEIKRWNPEGLSQPVGYSQVVTIEGNGKMVLLGGKAGLRPDGSMPETLAAQSKLTWENIDLALKAAGATREDVVEIEIFIVDLASVDPNPAYEDVRNFFPVGHKPVSMVIGVSALAIPELKMEINVRAIVAND
ncbi:MAG: RidA family protein [Proteobacteria bacterium]|jgi:2-iminobutanoate/2-iminopropanoate deaminase|nr:RidA family protein [Pseudomonadota bacterium]